MTTDRPRNAHYDGPRGERFVKAYVTGDSTEAIYLDAPIGHIPPPILQLWRPLTGYVDFYDASGYRLPLPADPRPDETPKADQDG